MMQFEAPGFVNRCGSTSSSSNYDHETNTSSKSSTRSSRKMPSPGANGRRTADLIFETQDALIRLTGPVKGLVNNYPAKNGKPFKTNGAIMSNFYSSEFNGGVPDYDNVSDFVPEEMSVTSQTSSQTADENPGMMRRLSTSISEFASAITSGTSRDWNSQDEGTSTSESNANSFMNYSKSPTSDLDDRSTSEKTPVSSKKTEIGGSGKKRLLTESSSRSTVFGNNFELGSDEEGDEDGHEPLENVSGHHNPFLNEITYVHDFYDSGSEADRNHSGIISSSNPIRTSTSYVGMPQHTPEKFHLSNSYSSYDLSLELKNRRRSLDIGFTDGFFAEPPKSLNSSTSGGSVSTDRKEQLLQAIGQCKKMLKQNQHDEKLKDKFGHQLVKLRLLLLEETDSKHEEHVRKLNGHKFVQSATRATSRAVCEYCRQLLIGLMHSWFECLCCGYKAHDRCLEAVGRVCPSVRLEESKEYFWNICNSPGLAKQNFRCAECKNLIGGTSVTCNVSGSTSSLASNKSNGSGGGEALLCDYSGMYYCNQCHWNDLMVIPARVLFNWDFRPYRVSRYWFAYLQMVYKRAIINISDLNKSLYNHIEELGTVNNMRKDILKMKSYFIGCRNASSKRLLLLLQSRQHFVENSVMYSLRDLVDLENKTLLTTLQKIYDLFSNHIRRDCEICKNRGFICEYCNSGKIIFPFDDDVFVCPKCECTYHERCYDNRRRDCLRCSRRRERKSTTTTIISEGELDDTK